MSHCRLRTDDAQTAHRRSNRGKKKQHLTHFSTTSCRPPTAYQPDSSEFGSSTDDYDICLASGDTVDPLLLCSALIQDGTPGQDNPLDPLLVECESTPGNFCFVNLQIVRFAGGDQTLEFFVIGLDSSEILDPGEIIPGDAIVGHAALDDVISTAAINADDPSNDDIAPYSSHGPSTITFPSPVVRPTPTVTGIDNVTVSSAWGGPVPFAGTSAAAPHIAGIAALMLEAAPPLTPSQVKAELQSTATDRGAAGFDNIYGAGLANAANAVPTNQAPTANSVSPSSGSGTGVTFGYAVSDPDGYQDLTGMQMLINETLAGANSCWLFYRPASNELYLQNDAGSAWLGPETVGTGGLLQNSKCEVNAGTSSVSPSGTDLMLNLTVEFPQGGAKTNWLWVDDTAGQTQGWKQVGTWTAVGTGNHSPAADSVTPSSGIGANVTFNYAVSDLDGYQDLTGMQMLINETLVGANSCWLFYRPASNELYLQNDAGSAWLGPETVGTGGLLQNSKCEVNAGTSSVSPSGTDLILDVAVEFSQAGNKTNWLWVDDTAGQTQGWKQVGTWTVPGAGNQPPTANSVTPSSGSGMGVTFGYAVSDPDGYQDLTGMQMLINETLVGANSCWVFYRPASNELYLQNDAGSAWLGPETVGTGGLLQNSKCEVNAGTSSVSPSGTDLILDVAVEFPQAGNKTNWLWVGDSAGQTPGWTFLGTWIAN